MTYSFNIQRIKGRDRDIDVMLEVCAYSLLDHGYDEYAAVDEAYDNETGEVVPESDLDEEEIIEHFYDNYVDDALHEAAEYTRWDEYDAAEAKYDYMKDEGLL